MASTVGTRRKRTHKVVDKLEMLFLYKIFVDDFLELFCPFGLDAHDGFRYRVILYVFVLLSIYELQSVGYL